MPVNYNFGEGGLIPELISKRLFLASTPSMNELLRSFSLSDGDLWLDFEATERHRPSCDVAGR